MTEHDKSERTQQSRDVRMKIVGHEYRNYQRFVYKLNGFHLLLSSNFIHRIK